MSKKMSWVMCVSILLGGCAMGVDRVKLYDPLEYTPSEREGGSLAYADVPEIKPVTGEKIPIAIKKIRDSRPDISKIGVKKNTYGIVMGKVDVKKGVIFLDVFTKNLINSLELAGYEVTSEKDFRSIPTLNLDKFAALLEADVRTFWVEFSPGFWAVSADSDAIFEVRLYEPETNREIWSETFRGKGKSPGLVITQRGFESSINQAYSKAMKSFFKTISDEELRNKLKK